MNLNPRRARSSMRPAWMMNPTRAWIQDLTVSVQSDDGSALIRIVDEGGDSDESASAAEDESEEGEDWDELERKAKRGEIFLSSGVSWLIANAQLTRNDMTSMTTTPMMAGERRRRVADADSPFVYIIIGLCSSTTPDVPIIGPQLVIYPVTYTMQSSHYVHAGIRCFANPISG